jgi:hypothetical protein
MAYELREGQGNLWKNDRKTEDKQPDVTGKAMIGGKLMYVSGWRKTTSAGKGWYSLAFKAVDEYSQEPPADGGPGF